MKKSLSIIIAVLIIMGLITALELGVCAIGGAFRMIQLVYGL